MFCTVNLIASILLKSCSVNPAILTLLFLFWNLDSRFLSVVIQTTVARKHFLVVMLIKLTHFYSVFGSVAKTKLLSVSIPVGKESAFGRIVRTQIVRKIAPWICGFRITYRKRTVIFIVDKKNQERPGTSYPEMSATSSP